jgi:signal transduction histidine kinase
MSLKKKFLVQNMLLALGLLLLAALSLGRLRSLREEVGASRYAYTELKTAETTIVHIARAQGLLASPAAHRPALAENLREAIQGLDDFIRPDKPYVQDPQAAAAYEGLVRYGERARQRLSTVLAAVEGDKPIDAGTPEHQTLVAAADGALWDLDAMVRGCTTYIRQRQDQASHRLDTASLLLGGLSAAAVVAALLITASQYRSVLAPLQRLRRGVRSVAAAKFSDRVDVAGPTELAELATDFNRQLEDKVRAASRELVRSERLASVGFLAAGVAHEINNPLNVISGYAELTIKRLRALDGEPAADDATRSLQIIRDEAFRCKQTTGKLLSLARSGSDAREPLSLAEVAAEVALMTRGLKNYPDREVKLSFDEAESLRVVANANEMKQVLLNLTINALQAVPPGTGEVRIEGRRRAEWVEVSVSDNGRGIPPEALKHVFEPFFTDKRGAGEPGTGLGLSITHAIVESHGGRICAESGGIGLGSRFTFALPAGGGDGNGIGTSSPATGATEASPGTAPGPGPTRREART